MPSVTNHPSYFPRRVNSRVPNLVYHSEVDVSGLARVELGVVPTSTNNGIINAQDITAIITRGGVFTAGYLANPASVMGPYGRNVFVTLSGAGTPTVTVRGRDYLGQPMSENLVAQGASPTTTAIGNKAFYYIDSITTSVGVGATTLSLGGGLKLGLPFTIIGVDAELVDDAIPTAGVLTAGTLTTQTIATNDPRGLYVPNAAPNGTRNYVLLGWTLTGQLHGVPHFSN